MHAREQRRGASLPHLLTQLRRLATNFLFDRVQCADPVNGFRSHRRGVRDVDLVELAPRMRPTRGFADPSGVIEVVEAGVRVGLQSAEGLLKVPLRMLALTVWRVDEPNGRRSRVCGRATIANLGPQPAGLGPAQSWREHRHGSVVRVQLASGEYVLAHGINQWRK